MPKRTDIRNALKTLMENELPGVGQRYIFLGRQRAIPAHLLPAICIYMENEEKTLASAGQPRQFDRGNDYIFEVHAQAATTQAVEDELDIWCERIETTLIANETLGGLVREIIPVIDAYDIEEDALKPAGVAECRYSIIHTA